MSLLTAPTLWAASHVPVSRDIGGTGWNAKVSVSFLHYIRLISPSLIECAKDIFIIPTPWLILISNSSSAYWICERATFSLGMMGFYQRDRNRLLLGWIENFWNGAAKQIVTMRKSTMTPSDIILQQLRLRLCQSPCQTMGAVIMSYKITLFKLRNEAVAFMSLIWFNESDESAFIDIWNVVRNKTIL